MEKIINFLKEVRVELSKVTWPTKKQTTVYTLVVIGISLFLAIFLGLLDFFFEFLLNKFIYLG
ncbi:MAG: preprotein translocase subunit SecE [Candidatus Yanofskybacteria bacterium RIFOXYD1_FULL_44_17]|nr:MAG: preprotein translocase subunit SecE [Candidatus Yanofskybacteria bacterium RIFOXYA1_FULL_44_17]OGN36572.1 MAG: preprotein translocase subunit SecE [Candidatus Yanofskybacteria bacterium RIFOXYA2_FULL_45_28]OGN37131.1 MAG: preprotein translocase subunit SecE [Candidatus Yanofskybacteria bacterium RIFOXYC1_FULL_44_16]OGN37663.1 MAG: preprotein translocase subunit SecE [Candidatus Yanofskybacteria bacterium RIFOXYB1_FULL_44_29]OGN37789.1 MAG: preprotein translocase subunit SecE [Candidatus